MDAPLNRLQIGGISVESLNMYIQCAAAEDARDQKLLIRYEQELYEALHDIGSDFVPNTFTRAFLAEAIQRHYTPGEAALHLRIDWLKKCAQEFLEQKLKRAGGEKIHGIKLIRALHGWSLKVSKDAYEELEAQAPAPPKPTPSIDDSCFDFIVGLVNGIVGRVESLEDWQRKVKGAFGG